MSLDPPVNPPPPSAPAWARDLYYWLSLVQDEVDTHAATLARNSSTLNQLGRQLMATQADVDALVAELNDAADEILAKISDLEAQVAAGQPVDLTALKTAADRLRDVVPDPAPPAA